MVVDAGDRGRQRRQGSAHLDMLGCADMSFDGGFRFIAAGAHARCG